MSLPPLSGKSIFRRFETNQNGVAWASQDLSQLQCRACIGNGAKGAREAQRRQKKDAEIQGEARSLGRKVGHPVDDGAPDGRLEYCYRYVHQINRLIPPKKEQGEKKGWGVRLKDGKRNSTLLVSFCLP